MSVAPHAGIIDFGTFTPPTLSLDGIQGEVPQPLIGQENYVLTGNGWSSLAALGGITYQGTWNASTNSPTLTSSVGTQGYYYVVSVAGSTNLNGITSWSVGDWAVFNGSVWQRIQASSTFGTMAYQNANAVSITGGTINGTSIGATTASTGTFTTLTAQTENLIGTGQNLLLRSQTLNNPSWGLNVSPTLATYTDPLGGSTATQFTTSAANSGVFQTITGTSGLTYTWSIYIKYISGDGTVYLGNQLAPTTGTVVFNSSAGTITSSGAAIVASGVVNAGSGWYRVWGTFVCTGSPMAMIIYSNNANAMSWAAWGAQYEIGSTLGTYVPTTTTAVYGTPSLSFSGVASLGLQSDGSVNLNTANGTGLRLSELAGGTVNTGFAIFSGTASQNTVYTVPYGTFANSNMYLASKGSGNLFLGTNSNNSATPTTQAVISHTASAVNYVQVTGAATNTPPVISSQGSDSNIALSFVVKGTGRHNFFNNGATSSRQFAIGSSGATNAINFLNVDGSATGNALPMQANGTDTNISMAFQPKGTGAIDLAAGSSGVNISNGGTVTAITRTNTGSGYTSFPTIAISAPTTAGGVTALATVAQMVSNTATIQAGGTGYTLNDVVTLVGGTVATVAATYTVTAVSAGVVTAVTPLNFTAYTVLPTNPVSVTGGTGTGLTLNVTYGVQSSFTIGTAGSGYIEQPTITFSGGGGSGAAAYATVGSGTTIKTLGSTLSFYTPQGEQVRITDANFYTGSSPALNIYRDSSNRTQLRSAGNLTLYAQTGGSIGLYTNIGSDLLQLNVAHTASAVNYVQVTGSTTTLNPTISAQGSDTNISLALSPKGTGLIQVTSAANIARNSYNWMQIAGGAATGNAPSINALGTDTNVDITLTPKGTGKVNATNATSSIVQSTGSSGYGSFLASSSTGNYAFYFGYVNNAEVGRISMTSSSNMSFSTNSSALEQFRVADTASAVNYVQVTGGTTGNRPTITAQGSDGNAGLSIFAKGTGGVFIGSNLGTTAAIVSTPTTGTNYFAVNGSATTIAPTIAVAGGDTNIPLALQTKGTGAIDLAAGSSGVNISNGGTVTAVTTTNVGAGYTSVPTIAISAPTTAGGTTATATVTSMGINFVTIVSGGTGYAVNDEILISGGTFTTQARYRITAVSGGVVTTLTPIATPNYQALPTNPASTTTAIGTGSGLTLTVNWAVTGQSFTAGSGYIEQPTVTFSGGGGSGAAAYATVGSNPTVKGLGSNINFATASGTGFALSDAGTTSAYWWQAIGGGSNGILRSTGASQSGLIQTQGTGSIYLQSNGGAQTQFVASHTASAVNYMQVTGSATGTRVSLSAQGSDTNVGITYGAKGTGIHAFSNGNGTQFVINDYGSAFVNRIETTPAATGLPPKILAGGTDTNISLVLQPKGTGALQAQLNDGTATGGNARGSYAVDWQMSRTNATQVASGYASVVAGGYLNTAGGSASGTFSGTQNVNGGSVSVIAGGIANNITGNATNNNYNFIGCGYANQALGLFNVIGGGYNNNGTANAAVTTQTGTANATTTFTLDATNASIKVGQLITGTNIQSFPNTYVSNIVGTTLTLSQAATGSGATTLSFYTAHSVIGGGGNNTATGNHSTVGGGGWAGGVSANSAANRATGDWATIAGGSGGLASGNNSTIGGGGYLIGNGNTASGQSSTVAGGYSNTVSGFAATCIGGNSNIANGNYGVVGGANNNNNAANSVIAGGQYGLARSVLGNFVMPACGAPIAAVQGVSQIAFVVLGRQTTDATPTVLASDPNTPAGFNQVALPNNSAYYFKGSVIAGVTGAGNTKAWSIEGAIKRGGGALTTVLVGSPTVTSLYADAGAAAWVVAVTVDTTYGALAITVTGQAATTIRWVAKIETTEMTY